MKEQTRVRCEQLVENKEKISTVFRWNTGLIHLACAGIFAAKDQAVEARTLQECKDLLKQRVGAFSNFRSTVQAPVVSMLALDENPERELECGLEVYRLLKNYFFTSAYLPLAAMMIAQLAPETAYEQIAVRTRALYDRMKAEHPFLTSGEDSAFCALMALSEKTDDVLIQEAESCYQILKGRFFSSNAVQSLSHVLALCDGGAEVKCQHTLELFDRLKGAGCRYGTEYELPTLGVLAMCGGNYDEIISEMTEIDKWLSGQKGFGFFSSITGKQRLMYAGILAGRDYLQENTMQTAAVNGTVSLIVAQEAAMCAAVAASSAAAASASSSN